MDWYSIAFEPNLKFALDLKEDLRTKYFEQYEKAKRALENFSCSLQDVFHKHHKLLSDNIELSIINEKLKQIINKHESNHQKILTLDDNQSSQILVFNENCNLEISNKVEDFNEEIDNKIFNKKVIAEKENINIFVDESKSFKKHNSPPPSVVLSTVKVQNSPILSTRKKLTSKKNNLSASDTSSNSINSNNNDKNSLTNIITIKKNLDEIENKSCKEFENKNNIESLKMMEDSFDQKDLRPKHTQDRNECYKILSISKTSFGKSEFIEKGKKLRQTKLTLKKIIPIIDIQKESSKMKSISLNNSTKIAAANQNQSLKDDELIEISPTQHEKSKLRNKLILNKKVTGGKVAVKTLSELHDKKVINFENSMHDNFHHKNNFGAYENKSNSCHFKKYNNEHNVIVTENYKKFEHKILHDETYFSPAEKDRENDVTYYNTNISKYEEEKYEIPPAKKMLLDSFDEIPDRKLESPNYAYKEAALRNKNEKAKLPGQCCRDCENWYIHLPEEERKNRENECSKHRGKYKADILTPESFWNPTFEDTHNSTSFEH